MNFCLLIALGIFRSVLIPVQFEDLKFTCSQEDIVSYAKGTEEYFNTQLPSGSSISVDIAPMVELPGQFSYYGANSGTRHDALIYKFVTEACRLADAQVDFSQYDPEGNFEVPAVLLLVPGPSEAEGAGENYFWPCQADLADDNVSLVLDGRRIRRYCISNEDGRTGTLCHEFGHLLGLPDFYDTDNSGSGGVSPGMYGTLSIMDKGNRNGSHMTPPYLNAVERELLGFDGGLLLETGPHTLAPIGRSGMYYRFNSSEENEYFLIECRHAEGFDRYIGGSGLVIYHIDKTGRDKGYSDYFKENLSAERRWEYNEINCRPGSECAMLVSADPAATDASGVFFGTAGHTSFSSGSTPSFAFHDGSVSSLALTDIRLNPDGSVSFNVTEPLVITSVASYQDAAIVSWETHTDTGEISYYEVGWYADGEKIKLSEKIGPSADGVQSYTIDKLKPGTDYTVVIRVMNKNQTSYSQVKNFSTRSYNDKIRPFIYLNDVERNPDGSFPSGARIPLRLYNFPGPEVEWYLDRDRIKPGPDGYYTLTRSGTLRALVTLKDGSTEVFLKEVTVR